MPLSRAQHEGWTISNPAREVTAFAFPWRFILTRPDYLVVLLVASGWRSLHVFMDYWLTEVSGIQSTSWRLLRCRHLPNAGPEVLKTFQLSGFIVALLSHVVISLFVGLMFAAILPMMPSRFTAFWGSFLAPVLWTALIASTLQLINPALNSKIAWGWFIASQIAYGLITGYIVAHSKWVETQQDWPLAARAGLEAPGLMPRRGENDEQTLRLDSRMQLSCDLSLLMGCNARLPGKPTEADRWRAPADVSDFSELYTQNCAGCHGSDGKLGAARSLNDSLYLSFIPDDALKQVISQGRTGTNMPAFSQQAGGTLTDRQIELLVSGMRAAWARPDDFKGVQLPSYSASGSGSTASERECLSNLLCKLSWVRRRRRLRRFNRRSELPEPG